MKEKGKRKSEDECIDRKLLRLNETEEKLNKLRKV